MSVSSNLMCQRGNALVIFDSTWVPIRTPALARHLKQTPNVETTCCVQVHSLYISTIAARSICPIVTGWKIAANCALSYRFEKVMYKIPFLWCSVVSSMGYVAVMRLVTIGW